MAKMFFTNESLETFVDEIKAHVNSKVSTKSNIGHAHEIANVSNLQSTLDSKAEVDHSHSNYSLLSHSHDDLYYTETEIDSKLSGKANSSHGNHVPTTQTANNSVFLRNDNSWATVTPANIGAATSSHSHTVANITDLIATATELNYMDGVTSNVQTQLDSKAASGHSHTITASASDDDVVVLTGTNGSNKVTYSASHANSGVTAGTYKSVTVNAKGHITAGSNPTTLSGYGITNAYTKTEVDTIASGKAATSHNHAASNITSGTLSSDRLPTVPIAKGGTGATTAAGVLTNLGITATATELNYVDGVTSNIQTQLNGKSGTSHTHNYLPLSGGTITGQLDADKVFRNGNTFYNVLEFASTTTVDEIVIKTKIPFQSGNSMPLVHLKGYAYGESATIEMTVAFYIYNDKFTNMGVVSSCPWKPSVYLSSYTENNIKYVAISFAGSIYYPRFVIDYTDIWSGSSNRDYSSGWTSINRASGETTSIIFSTDKVEVPYKPIANNISGNATTATNVAWSGVTSKPSYYDAKAIKSITRSGTTFTYTCMDGTTGTFTQQDNNTTYNVATTSANGLMSASDKSKLDSMELATLAEVKTYLGI